MFLVCHVTSPEYMFKGFCEFMGGSPSRWVTTLPIEWAIGLVQVDILVVNMLYDLTKPPDLGIE